MGDWLNKSLRRFSPFDMNCLGPRNHAYGQVPMPNFSGNPSESPSIFFSRFEKYVGYLGICAGDYVQILGCVLNNRALEVFDEINDEFNKRGEVCDFNTIKRRILDDFTDRKPDFVNWNALHRRKLRLNETIRNYYADLRHLNRKLNTPIENLLYIFISGLPNSFKFHVFFQHPLNISEAVEIASEYESVTNYFGEVDVKEKNVLVNAIPKKSKEIKELQDQLQSLRSDLERIVSDNQFSGNTPCTRFVARSAAISSNNEMTIDIILGGIKLKGLIDSGSDISLISNNILQDTALSHTLGVSDFTNVISVGGKISPFLGVAEANISFGDFKGNVKLHVLENSPYPVILGRDFLRENVKVIDIVNHELILLHTGLDDRNICVPLNFNSSNAVMRSGVKFHNDDDDDDDDDDDSNNKTDSDLIHGCQIGVSHHKFISGSSVTDETTNTRGHFGKLRCAQVNPHAKKVIRHKQLNSIQDRKRAFKHKRTKRKVYYTSDFRHNEFLNKQPFRFYSVNTVAKMTDFNREKLAHRNAKLVEIQAYFSNVEKLKQ